MKTLLLTLTVLLCGEARAQTPIVVDQKDRSFSQSTIAIHAGNTIRFNNRDEFGHQVYTQSSGFSFDTDESDPGSYVDVRFPKSGYYTIYCHIHPKMRMDVDVK